MSRRYAAPLALSAVVGLSALFASTPIVDAVTGGAIPDASLVHSWSFLAGAPVFAILDQLSILTVPQHVALLLTCGAAFASLRVLRYARRRELHWRREVTWSGAFMATVLVIYGTGLVAWRPMARLTMRDPDLVVVDFHSHTDASHDGRPGFDAEANRAWHADAGYDVAYVTDHMRHGEIAPPLPRNPTNAGEGTLLVPGLEIVDHGVHVVGLTSALLAVEMGGAYRERVVEVSRTPPLADVRLQPLLIHTIPARIDRVAMAGREGFDTGVMAIELVDGAPRGLDQGARDHDRILHLADAHDLAVVGSSNNHGWGRTAATWSVLRLPGWRDDDAPGLAARIEGAIRERRRAAVRVVARRRIPSAGPLRASVLVAPMLAVTTLTTLSTPERVAWLAWIWAIALAARLRDGGARQSRGRRDTCRGAPA